MEEEYRNIKDKECKEGFSSQIKEWSIIVKEYTNHADIASLQNVSFRYERGSAYVLRDFHLSIREGEIFCLLGESGCGKTTCLQIFGGFLIPEKGDVLLSGEKFTMLPPEKRPVATVFQSYALFPHLNVVENVSYGLKQKGMKKRKEKSLRNGIYRWLVSVDMKEETFPHSAGDNNKEWLWPDRLRLNRNYFFWMSR